MPSRPWATLTDAEVLNLEGLKRRKAERAAFVVGFVGFSGGWTQNPIPRAQARAAAAIDAALATLRDEHGARLWVASGATDLGVPALVYAACARRSITAVGVTAGAAARYRLAPMAMLVPVGRRFGDESPAFLAVCDALWIVGGGAQSRREALMAAGAGKPVTVLRGVGGAADALTAEELPTARFLTIPP